MKFVLQISTGYFSNCLIQDSRKMADQLESLLNRLPVSRMIFGWGFKGDVLDRLLETARKHRVQSLLWLPVFADTEHPEMSDHLKALYTEPLGKVQTCAGETFSFECPASAGNLELALASCNSLLSGQSADGVFLDRIRYPSAVFSRADFFGCHCEACNKRTHELGIDTEHLRRKALAEGDLGSFAPSSTEDGRYHYDDPALEQLCSLKRETVLHAVQKLAEAFRRKNMIVGIDTFAPALADLVGQDLNRLADAVDFMKPMMYYKTTAPAGVPYELHAYGEAFAARISQLWGTDVTQASGIGKQLCSLHGKAKIIPGMEVNSVPGICEPGEEDLLYTLRRFADAGCDETVLSWNVINAPEKNIQAIEKALPKLG